MLSTAARYTYQFVHVNLVTLRRRLCVVVDRRGVEFEPWANCFNSRGFVPWLKFGDSRMGVDLVCTNQYVSVAGVA